ncbi:hypothetical protein OEZ86_002317 [Tetradesmus obliquus]|nr:hypothetical protein OEZ86_002317 [Tetradesmus obliquus]
MRLYACRLHLPSLTVIGALTCLKRLALNSVGLSFDVEAPPEQADELRALGRALKHLDMSGFWPTLL